MISVVGDLIPVLWLCGPPGIGKSTVGWEIFTQLAQAGIEAGYVDIDQLGICYPEPSSDPGRHRMKAQNLGAVVANYRAAGARCVIVSGVVDPGRGVPACLIPRAAMTVCRLRARRDELRQRFLGRGGQPGLLDEVLSQAGAMDASHIADVCVDTSGLAAAEAARLVRERIAGWPILTGPARPDEAGPHDRPATAADGPILVLCGATGVRQVAAGEDFTVALRSNGEVSTWGRNDIGQLGDGTLTDRTTPARNLTGYGITQVSAGRYYALALRPGSVWAWGDNYFGELGNGSAAAHSATPVIVDRRTQNATQIVAGTMHAFTVDPDGSLWAWGDNSRGQLGLGLVGPTVRTPQKIPGLAGVTQLAAGDVENIARRSDGYGPLYIKPLCPGSRSRGRHRWLRRCWSGAPRTSACAATASIGATAPSGPHPGDPAVRGSRIALAPGTCGSPGRWPDRR